MGIDRVLESIHKALIWVIDRGGDRDQIIRTLIRIRQYFIIRLVGRRHLEYKGKPKSIRQISKKVPLLYCLTSRRIRKNRLKFDRYQVGIVPVKYIDTYTHLTLEQSPSTWLS